MKRIIKKKWFTLLELIIVIGIILVLIVTFRNIFWNTNKDYLYAETCINKIHGDMNNFIYSAMTSRGLYISTGSVTWTIYPLQYTISFVPTNEIHLRYKDQNNNTWTYIRHFLSSNELSQSYCSMNTYTTKLSGDSFTITINKASLQDQTLPTFTINNGQEIFTKTTEMYLCYTGNNCKEIANFITDIRTQSIQKKKCILINKEGTPCLQRDQ